jgi:hypothetical protein
MAEMLTITEIRNYALSNGTTANLEALISTDVPADWRTPVIEDLAVGQVAYVDAMGEMRRGVIVKIGRTKIHVAFTTRGAIDHSGRYRKDGLIRVQTTGAGADWIKVAPLAPATTLEEPAETAEREAEQEELEGTLPEGFEVTESGEMVEVAPEQDETTEAERAELDEMLAGWEDEGGAVAPLPPAPVLDPVTGYAIVEVLEETWAAIRAEVPELPHVVMVTGSAFVGPGRWAHWRESGWTEKGHEGHSHTRHGEMFVAGETLAKGATFVVETMLHEGAHALATVRKIQDTSRQGRWHNGEFRKLGEELGLEYTKGNAHTAHGYSFMTITETAKDRYAALITKLDAAIRATIAAPAWTDAAGGQDTDAGGEYVHGGRRPKTGGTSTTNNLKLTCECENPTIIRASKTVAAKMTIRCDVCAGLFLDRG